jgi:SAM-dependent methyltransferase
MHQSVIEYLQSVKVKKPELFDGAVVLEFGSRNINGTPRSLFTEPKNYVGVDCHEGAGVDWVGICHEYDGLEDGSCDVVVTTEMFEHDPYVKQTVSAAYSKLRSGGLFVGTCAAKARKPHHPEDSPTPGYYGGVDPEDMIEAMNESGEWSEVDARFDRGRLDTVFYGIKA